MREDKVEIYGSKGKITFSVFENDPLILTNDIEQKIINIEHPENIQLYHAQQSCFNYYILFNNYLTAIVLKNTLLSYDISKV